MKQTEELRNRLDQQSRSDANVRRTSRTKKVSREHEEYLNEIHLKGLKHDLLKLSQIIEASTESLKTHDYNNVATREIEQNLEAIHSNWLKYLKIYEEYSQLLNDSRKLERLSIQRQNLERKMNDCNRVAIDQLNKSINSLQKGKGLMNIHHIRDDDKLSVSVHSSISMSRSSKSRHSGRSSVSSRAKVAAREAQLANLKLEQAERRAKAKQKQMQEQIEQELQDLRDQVEYSQLEAQLLADDQVDERSSDSSSRKGKSKAGTNDKKLASPIVVKGAACEMGQSSTPHKLSESPSKLEQCDNRAVTPPLEVSEEPPPSLPEFTSHPENSKQELTTTLLEMNQQLVSAMKQGSETTTVMKAILQRQGIPKPQPVKFRGDPAQFPVFKKRVEVWLN